MADHKHITSGRTGKPLRVGALGNTNCVTHGHTIGKDIPPEYNSWKGMRQRCNNPNHPKYSLYGGRGIRVCERWDASFSDFLHDMGKRPGPGYSLDRINNDGDYTPSNVRWATQSDQCRNQRRNSRVQFGGELVTLAEIKQRTGIDGSHLRYHMKAGRTADEAVAFILANRV